MQAQLESRRAIHLRSAVGRDADREAAREAIGALGPALEIVDIDIPMEDVERILAGNIFHRAVMLGPPDPQRAAPPSVTGIEASVLDSDRVGGSG